MNVLADLGDADDAVGPVSAAWSYRAAARARRGRTRRLEPRVRDSVADRSIGEQVYCRNAATRDVRNALLLMIEKKP